jgi:hypothetical protein
LRGFRFIGGVTQQALRVELDRWLLARIGSADRLSEKRDHLLLELGRQACSGDAHIDAKTFLESSGLADSSLSEWAALSRKAHMHLMGALRRKHVELSEDVRPGLTARILEKWTTHRPVLVLTGESGTGKTWHGYRALLKTTEAGDIAILVDSRGDADLDMTQAASSFWHRIVGVDEAPPLIRLRARLKQVNPANQLRPLTILVDNVSSSEEARRLVEEDWETLGVRLAITCPPNVAEIVRPLLGDRGYEIRIDDYTLGEVQMLLSRVVGIGWEDVPFDVQKTIRRPLLADLLGGLVSDDGWQARNEYDLYQRAWNDLRQRGVKPLDHDALRRLALGVLASDARYPWTAKELQECGLNGDALDRLLTAGWLRETTGGEVEIWHDRLLNWTVAEAFAHELKYNSTRAEANLTAVANLMIKPLLACGRNLGYVPLDVMWLVSGAGDNDLLARLVAACESVLGWRATEILHKEHLPTLGNRAVPLLLKRLRTTAESGPSYVVNHIIDGLVATADEGIREHAMELLASPSAKVRRAGVGLITALPTADAMDRLWAIHVEGLENPNPYLWQHSAQWSLREDTFAALKACASLNLPWLERTIQEADPAKVPVHELAYLVATVADEGVWRRKKETLLLKVDAAHERAIASCVLTFRDRDQIESLEARIEKMEDLVGPVSLRALTAIDPRRALSLLDRLDDSELYLTRNWCFAELHLRAPSELMAHFATTLRTHDRPWRYCLVLQGREDLIDAESFDFLLDRLTVLFSNSMAAGDAPDLSSDRRWGISFINAVNRPELLDRLRRRRGTALEQKLAEWAIALGPQLGEWKALDKFVALDALARIGGEGFNRVLNVWLERAGFGGRLHAIQLAQRRVTPRTIELLSEQSVAEGPEDEPQRSALNGYAAAALAAHCCWGPVLRYYLRVGLKGLSVVEECVPNTDSPLDDATLGEALSEFRAESGPTAGSVLCIGLASRRDLLPDVRTALNRSEPGSDLAAACLLSLQWLRDTDPDAVSAIAPHVSSHKHHATMALLVNGSSAARAALDTELRCRPDIRLAIELANDPRHRDTGIATIRKLVANEPQFRFQFGFTNLVAALHPDLLRAVAEYPEVSTLAEEVGYSPYTSSRIQGEKPAALRILGVKQPDAAVPLALARLRAPNTPDAALYVPVIGTLARDDSAIWLLDIVRLDPPTRIIQSIGRELGRLGSVATVLEWLRSPTAERRLAACRVAGFLSHTDALDAEVRARAEDADKRVADASVEAHERLRRSRTTNELVRAFVEEPDETHRWVLLDALIAIAEGAGSAIRPKKRIVSVRLSRIRTVGKKTGGGQERACH